MSVPSNIFAVLGPLVSSRCYPNTFLQATGSLPAWPAIRYVILSETPYPDQCGTETVTAGDADDSRVQIDIVDNTYAGMRALKSAAMSALSASDQWVRQGAGFEEYDAETKTHRAALIFEFRANSA